MMLMTEVFFMKIMYADIKRFSDPGLHDWPYLDDKYTPSEADREAFGRIIESLSNRIRVFIGPDKFYTGRTVHDRSTHRNTHLLIFGLNPEYLAFFSQYSYEELPTDLKHAVLMSLATTIAHEMAHLFGRIREIDRLLKDFAQPNAIRIPAQKEALSGSKSPLEKEYGHAWERYMFEDILRVRTYLSDGNAEGLFQ